MMVKNVVEEDVVKINNFFFKKKKIEIKKLKNKK